MTQFEDDITRKNPDLTLIDSDRLTSKEEHFARLRASGTPQGDAYRQSYGCDGSAARTIAVEANRVETKPRVTRRILELRDAHASAVVSYSVAAAMSELDESEPPQVLRRLQSLGGWSDEEVEQVITQGP